MAEVAKKGETSLQKLVREARNLRDHLLRIEGQDSLALVSALRPFDRDAKWDHLADADINELSGAFQNAFDNALTTVDAYTLNEVLNGRSPHLRRHHSLTSPLLAIIGFVLVLGAFHYSYWSNRATFVIQEAEDFVSFDHFGHMMQLVELENYFEQSEGTPSNSDLEPQLVYLEQFTALKTQYNSEVWLPQRMLGLRDDFNPITKWITNAKRRYCGTDSAIVAFLSCPNTTQLQQLASTASGFIDQTRTAVELQNIANSSSFRESLSEIARIESATMKAAGREVANTYAQSRYFVIARTQELQERLNIVHLWALPIIYGALGSIVIACGGS